MENFRNCIVEELEKAGFTSNDVKVSESGYDVVVLNNYISLMKVRDVVDPITTVVITPGTCYNDTEVRRDLPFSKSGEPTPGCLDKGIGVGRYFPQSVIDTVSNQVWETARKAMEVEEPVELKVNVGDFQWGNYFIRHLGRQTFEVFSDEDVVPFEVELHETFNSYEGWRNLADRIADAIFENILDREYWASKSN